MLSLGEEWDLLWAIMIPWGPNEKKNVPEKEAVEEGNGRRWCPSESVACSFSALSDTPAKSYAPELGRPKGEYRVSYILHCVISLHSLTYFDICYLA